MDSEVAVFLGNLLDLVIKGIISKEKCLVLSETSGRSQNSRVIRGFFCFYFPVCIIGTMLSWLTALHRKPKSKKQNSKGNIYHAGCALAESIAHLCRTSTRPRALLQHQVILEDKVLYDHSSNWFLYIHLWSNILCQYWSLSLLNTPPNIFQDPE